VNGVIEVKAIAFAYTVIRFDTITKVTECYGYMLLKGGKKAKITR
jgi:hypothetical protein